MRKAKKQLQKDVCHRTAEQLNSNCGPHELTSSLNNWNDYHRYTVEYDKICWLFRLLFRQSDTCHIWSKNAQILDKIILPSPAAVKRSHSKHTETLVDKVFIAPLSLSSGLWPRPAALDFAGFRPIDVMCRNPFCVVGLASRSISAAS
jgi:hypothetical protein